MILLKLNLAWTSWFLTLVKSLSVFSCDLGILTIKIQKMTTAPARSLIQNNDLKRTRFLSKKSTCIFGSSTIVLHLLH